MEIASSLRSAVIAPALPKEPALGVYLLCGPGRPIDRSPVSPSPCSHYNDDWSELQNI